MRAFARLEYDESFLGNFRFDQARRPKRFVDLTQIDDRPQGVANLRCDFYPASRRNRTSVNLTTICRQIDPGGGGSESRSSRLTDRDRDSSDSRPGLTNRPYPSNRETPNTVFDELCPGSTRLTNRDRDSSDSRPGLTNRPYPSNRETLTRPGSTRFAACAFGFVPWNALH
jgi:hypothetical protein